jgi:hypothetical protein
MIYIFSLWWCAISNLLCTLNSVFYFAPTWKKFPGNNIIRKGRKNECSCYYCAPYVWNLRGLGEAVFTPSRKRPKLGSEYRLLRIYLFLAYFTKLKAGLSNEQSFCVSVCPPLITFEPLGRISWNLVRRWCHSREPRCNNSNHISSITLKLLRFKFVRWALLNCGFGLFMFHGNTWNQVVYCSTFG